MNLECLSRLHCTYTSAVGACTLVFAAVLFLAPGSVLSQSGPTINPDDPRANLGAGWMNAEVAGRNLIRVASAPRPEPFLDPDNPGNFTLANTDLAFSGNFAYLGSYNGLQVWDISDPENPQIRTTLVCPGGQGDVSIYGDLLFMSVEEPRGRIDCGTEGVAGAVSEERFRGVRIFDVSNVDEPTQVGAVQTCRGSHTHTLVTDPDDSENVYIYVAGTNPVRPGAELEGCSGLPPEEDPNTALFRIEVIQVPLDAPQDARVVNTPRIFADEETGDIAGLWRGGPAREGAQTTSETNQCHDITVYPELGLAAGACSGNGILLDISDPANPQRIHEVLDPNFAYWHSATFSNDADKILFTDEWGGGMAARCRISDPAEWGANAIFTLEEGEMQHAGYYKLPTAQTDVENCVAHNGSLIPVPGRDIMVQAWYQGGVSVLDFTDPAHPVEIAYFDRGPVDADRLVMGGYWSAYWYNGYIYGSEIVRGLDVFELAPSAHLSQNEIDAARLVRFETFNPQHQTRIEWPAEPVVAHAYLDQLERDGALPTDWIRSIRDELDRLASGGTAAEAAAERLAPVASELIEEAERLDRVTTEAAGGVDAARESVNIPRADRLRRLASLLRELPTAG